MAIIKMTNALEDVVSAGRDRPATGSLDKIEITLAMTEAGVYAAREHCLGSPLDDLVYAVYVAMKTEELDAERASVLNKLGNVGNE